MTASKSDSTLLCIATTAMAVLIAGYWCGRVAVGENHHEDLWIYSSGAWLAQRGENPYDVEKIHARVEEMWPGDPVLGENSGFFLAPQALLIYAPFANMPWEWAKPVWCAITICLSAAAGWGLRDLSGTPLPGWFTAASVVAVLLNPLSLFVLIVGQTTLLVLSCVILGEVAERRGLPRLGRLLWAVVFIKPHIALPLLPLAWWLGGWRRAGEIAIWVVLLNLISGVVYFGNPLFALDYVRAVQDAHQTVRFNRVGGNIQLTSWNTFVAAAGGPVFDLGLVGTLVGYVIASLAITVRVWFARQTATPEWKFAVAGCAAPFCCQLLPYELVFTILGLPYLIGLALSKSLKWQVAAFVLVAGVLYTYIPNGDGQVYPVMIEKNIDPVNVKLISILNSNRSIGNALLLVTTLITGCGPCVRRTKTTSHCLMPQ